MPDPRAGLRLTSLDCTVEYKQDKMKIPQKITNPGDFRAGTHKARMIEKDIRTNNELYVCPVFNELILDGGKVRVKTIDESGMWGLGTPEDLTHFLTNYKGKY